MHELSIAMSIIDIAAEEAERRGGARVAAVHLKLGPLSGVVPAALCSAYELAREGSPLEAVALVIEDVPIAIQCPTCRCESSVVSVQHLCCSRCGTPSREVIRGRELEVSALEIIEA